MMAGRAACAVALLLLGACVADRSAQRPPPKPAAPSWTGPVRQPAKAAPPKRVPPKKPAAKPSPKLVTAPPPLPAPVTPPPAAWEARSVLPSAIEVRASTYLVVAGDTLRRISDKTGASSEGIARANDIAPPFVVKLGQKLHIPAGRYHRIGKGESGIAIARAYGVQWSRVATLNALEEPYILRDGQRLMIPSRAEVQAMTIEQRAAAFRLDIEDLVTGGEPALAENARPAPPVRTAKRTLPPTAVVGEPATNFSGRFVWPLTGRIIRPFGPLDGGRRNDGLNIAAAQGAPVAAAADGVVAYAGTDIPAYGGLILIRHGDGWITAYGHADALLVKRGQAVKRGEIIARAGESGFANEPQLHFEIRQGRKPINPMTLLPKRG